METAGQAETAMSPRWWEPQEGDRACFFFLATGQKMNMSARVVFGKGRLAPKQLSFAFPQTDSLRKGSRSTGGKRRMFSFSLRCRLGIIRGRTKGKADVCLVFYLFFLWNSRTKHVRFQSSIREAEFCCLSLMNSSLNVISLLVLPELI